MKNLIEDIVEQRVQERLDIFMGEVLTKIHTMVPNIMINLIGEKNMH